MQRPRREEFILDVRRSARTLQMPNVPSDSDAVDTDAIANILRRATLWLTPKVVEHFHPEDFTHWQEERQNNLRLAVEQFLEIARQVPVDKPATPDQFTKGVHRFRNLIEVLGNMVLEEWMRDVEAVEKQAEEWSAEADWRSRRVAKKMTETLMGTYEAPQLLIFAEPNLYVLDPIARFVPGGQGAFDLAIQPSYYATSLYRDDNGKWYVHLDFRNGVSKGRRVGWGKDAFRECIEQMKVLV